MCNCSFVLASVRGCIDQVMGLNPLWRTTKCSSLWYKAPQIQVLIGEWADITNILWYLWRSCHKVATWNLWIQTKTKVLPMIFDIYNEFKCPTSNFNRAGSPREQQTWQHHYQCLHILRGHMESNSPWLTPHSSAHSVQGDVYSLSDSSHQN